MKAWRHFVGRERELKTPPLRFPLHLIRIFVQRAIRAPTHTHAPHTRIILAPEFASTSCLIRLPLFTRELTVSPRTRSSVQPNRIPLVHSNRQSTMRFHDASSSLYSLQIHLFAFTFSRVGKKRKKGKKARKKETEGGRKERDIGVVQLDDRISN